MREDPHPSQQEWLLAAGGELAPRHSARVYAHLGACPECRASLEAMETAIEEFTRAYRSAGPAPPPIEGPRALLKARLAESAAPPRGWSWPGIPAAVAVLAMLAIVSGAIFRMEFRAGRSYYETQAIPRFSLTPGAVRLVSREEVCSAGAEENVRVVPASLRRRVFEEYGMPQGRPEAFEVDYLVTPELGGADDIRNLWPQPYEATVWNAHVKDALEGRLHQMVCSGQLDLATAQRDLAKDWISAYKKYFHTDKPY